MKTWKGIRSYLQIIQIILTSEIVATTEAEAYLNHKVTIWRSQSTVLTPRKQQHFTNLNIKSGILGLSTLN